MEEKILNEIAEYCGTCNSCDCCSEEECILWRIEQIVSNSKED